MSFRFCIQITSDVEPVVDKVKTEIINNGGKFSGDYKSGSITINLPIGSVSGVYDVNDKTICLTINSKPIYLTQSKIESEIRNYINK